MCNCCRLRDLLAFLWAAAFGSDLGFKKAANRGNSEALFSIFGHPLSEPRKCNLAKLRQSVTEVKKDGSQRDNGGWVRNFFILLSLVGCQLRRLGGACQPLLPFRLPGLASIFHLYMIVPLGAL